MNYTEDSVRCRTNGELWIGVSIRENTSKSFIEFLRNNGINFKLNNVKGISYFLCLVDGNQYEKIEIWKESKLC